MKSIKVIIIATILTICIIFSCAYAMPAGAEELDRGEFYPRLTVVVNTTRIETQLWVVECRDQWGHTWAFYDDEGTWNRGDIANLMMWAVSENPENDEVIDVYWAGYTENPDNFVSELGWK